MLDEKDGQVEVVPDPADEPRQLLHLLVAEPAGRLVQQQQPRARGERARDLDALLQAVREARSPATRPGARGPRTRASPAPADRRRAGRAGCAFRRGRSPRRSSSRRARRSGTSARCPRWTTRYVGVRSSDFPSKTRSPDCGLYSRVITLKSVVLPAPFGPIRPTISPGCGLDRDVVERDDPAEPPGDVLDREQGRHRANPKALPRRWVPLVRVRRLASRCGPVSPRRSRPRPRRARRTSSLRRAGAQSSARTRPTGSRRRAEACNTIRCRAGRDIVTADPADTVAAGLRGRQPARLARPVPKRVQPAPDAGRARQLRLRLHRGDDVPERALRRRRRVQHRLGDARPTPGGRGSPASSPASRCSARRRACTPARAIPSSPTTRSTGSG